MVRPFKPLKRQSFSMPNNDRGAMPSQQPTYPPLLRTPIEEMGIQQEQPIQREDQKQPLQSQEANNKRLYQQKMTVIADEMKDEDTQTIEAIRQKINEQVRTTIGLLDRKDTAEGKEEIRKIITQTFYNMAPFAMRRKAEHYIQLFYNDLCGLGPLQPLLNEPTISEITVYGPDCIWIEEHGVERMVDVKFRDQEHVMDIIQRIVSPIGRKIDLMEPVVDAFLDDGSRVNVAIPPIAVHGPYISIRKFVPQMDIDEICARGTFQEEIKEVLRCIAEGSLNICISGGTGSGKTTILNAICRYIPRENEALVTIEDTLELDLDHPKVRSLLTRGANIEGKGEVTASMLVKNALRMKPTRIIVGEVRDAVVLDCFNAMNSGHPGSLFSIHCNKPEDLPERIELMSGLPKESIHPQVAKIIHIVVQVNRLKDGRRRMTHISQFMGYENGKVQIQHLFEYDYEKDRLVRTKHPFRFEKELLEQKIEIPRILKEVGTDA